MIIAIIMVDGYGVVVGSLVQTLILDPSVCLASLKKQIKAVFMLKNMSPN